MLSPIPRDRQGKKTDGETKNSGVVSSAFSCYWRLKITFLTSGDYTWAQAQLFIWM